MSQEFRTLEMARLYEKQAYYDDALGIYEALAAKDPAHAEARAGIERIRSLMSEYAKEPVIRDAARDDAREKIAQLCEKWLRLMILKQRFHNFQNIKARVI